MDRAYTTAMSEENPTKEEILADYQKHALNCSVSPNLPEWYLESRKEIETTFVDERRVPG